MNSYTQDLEDLQDLEEILNEEIRGPLGRCWEILAEALSVEQAIKQAVMELEDKSKSKEIIGMSYEETLELRYDILQACKKGAEYLDVFVKQLLTNLEAFLKKIAEKNCLFGFVCLIWLGENNPKAFRKLEKGGKRALGNLRIEEDVVAGLFVEQLEKILPVRYPNHRGKIMALQYFPNGLRKAVIKIISKRYVLPKVPLIFLPEENIKHEKGFTFEFLNRNDAEKEAKVMIVEYMRGLSPQARSQRDVGEFLLNKLKSCEIDEYVKQTESGFRIDTRRIQKDSGKPLRSVERFLEGLTKFCHQKQVPSFNS